MTSPMTKPAREINAIIEGAQSSVEKRMARMSPEDWVRLWARLQEALIGCRSTGVVLAGARTGFVALLNACE